LGAVVCCGAVMASWVEFMDTALFHLINQDGQNSFFDWFMPFMTDLKNFTYILVILGAYIVWRERKGGLVFLLFVGLTVAVTDSFSSRLLKEWVGRIRPCQVLENVRLLTDCNTSYSFPSSHAVNIFAVAYFLSQMFRRLAPLFFAIAAVVGYSRVYMGIHYPLDVIGGAAIGLLIAWPMRRLKDWVLERLNISPPKRGEKGGVRGEG
jgi:undecaprenyl-diphosphatase